MSSQHRECFRTENWESRRPEIEANYDQQSTPIFEKSFALGITSEDAIFLSSNIFDINRLAESHFNLTKSELLVAKLICRGYSNQEIANIRLVSGETIKRQVSDILSKTNCRNRTEILVLTAILTAHSKTIYCAGELL